MVLLRLFISLIPLFLWGLDTKFHITTDINLYSDKLYFDVFSHKWEELPSDKSTNRAINFSNMAIYKNYQKFSIGYRYRSEGILEINKGFIETWYYASNDFNTLLKKKDIGYYINEPEVYGILEYYQLENLFFKKNLKNFIISINLFRPRQLQYMKVNGINSKNRFIADIDYYYTDKNILTKTMDNDNYYGGYGGSIDLEFINKNFLIGIYNIGGFIDWKSITHLKYHFDSDTKYIGEDGYYHYRPFGVGQYYINSNFHQLLPIFIKYHYQFQNIGLNGMYANNTNYNTIYLKYGYIKIGYIPQNKNIVYGFNSSHFSIELSQNIKYHSTYAKLYLDIAF